jgi:hypothetical protein
VELAARLESGVGRERLEEAAALAKKGYVDYINQFLKENDPVAAEEKRHREMLGNRESSKALAIEKVITVDGTHRKFQIRKIPYQNVSQRNKE